MGQALYRKHRVKNMREMVGQSHITDTLSNALKTGNISHAYLFTGPRGTGKTSVARILAHEINNLPYDGTNYLDIIEIDAASNRRIDEIRELRDKIHIAPTQAPYKVYIIDEAHMLTKEAFNALLKTLEEPPKHVVFILATTEAHKLPATIISRTQRFSFKPAETADAVKHLSKIAKAEKIDITDDALEMLAVHGNGSFRDSISMLDQASSLGNKIDLKAVQSILGLAPQEAITGIATLLKGDDTAALLGSLEQLHTQGFNPSQISTQLSKHLRQELLSNTSSSLAQALELLQKLLEVPSSNDPQKKLELTLLGVVFNNQPVTIQNVDKQTSVNHGIEPATSEPAPKQKEETRAKHQSKPAPSANATTSSKHEEIEDDPDAKPTVSASESLISDDVWQKVLQAVKAKHNTIYSVARMALPRLEDGALVLSFGYAFHKKRMDESRTKLLLQEIIAEQTGQTVKILCEVQTDVPKKTPSEPVKDKTTPEPKKSGTLDTITDIFGGGEVLEG